MLRAQAKTILRIGWTSGDGAQDPYAVGARAFQKALAARIGDRIEVQLYPNRAIGDERPLLDGMRLGTVDMGVITNAVIAQVEPAFQVNDMPFLFGSEAQAHKVLDGAVGAQLRQRLESKGVVPLGYMEGGFRHMINNVRPIARPEDLHGIKFRVLQSPIYIEMYRSWAATRCRWPGARPSPRAAGRHRRAGDPARRHRPEQVLRGDEIPVADRPYLFDDRPVDRQAQPRTVCPPS